MASTASEQGKRLLWARKAKGYESAASAARALDIPSPTYSAHENGSIKLTRQAERYARFFGVSMDWLLTGRGEPKPRRTKWSVPVAGVVGAGAAVEPINDAAGDEAPDDFTLPDPEGLAALVVKGESQMPRYAPGEIIIYDIRPLSPRELVNEMAIVHCEDGRRLVKRIRKSGIAGRWTLESLNASLEEDVALTAAYEIVGSLKR